MLENIAMFYDEFRETLDKLGIITSAEIDIQLRLLRELARSSLTPVWGVYRVCGVT